MLTELRVRDLVVIKDVTLPLKPGLNVLTGETGAGKSMLVDALALMLGERASADLIRPGAQRAVVEAAFDVAGVAGVGGLVDELGIDLEDDGLVIRREINAEGRNRAWANGSPTTVGALATLGQLLVDLHGQHETQSLLKPATQREILDAFGESAGVRAAVAVAYGAAAQLRAEEDGLVARRDDVQKRADYLRHVAKEISDAKPKPGEDEALETEAKRLGNVEELTQLTERLLELLEGAGGAAEAAGAADSLGAAGRTLGQLERIDEGVAKWREMLDSALTNVEELALAVRAYAADIDADPQRLAAVEHRRDVLYRLMQKYGPTIDDVIRTGDDARNELDLLDTADLDLEALSERRRQADRELQRLAAELTARRQKTAGKLAREVQRLLPGLGMPEGKFAVTIEPAPAITATGADQVEFVVQLNPGIEARPLRDVASGGELSRLMLALKVVLAAHDAVPTLVFDEVDQGIGGEVALQVGEALLAVSRARQVLVITHLPQIAARAQHHLSVAKRARGGIATADVAVLAGKERVDELARMLGDPEDPVVVQHASEMLNKRYAVSSER